MPLYRAALTAASARALVANTIEAIVFTAQAYTTVLGDLTKTKLGTTGATDATVTLLAAASAGEGARQKIAKDDTGVGRLIVMAAGIALDILHLKGEATCLEVVGGVWSLATPKPLLLVAKGNVQLVNPNNTGENVLATVTIPAGLLKANSVILVDALVNSLENANVKTYRVRLGGIGGTAFASMALTSLETATGAIDMTAATDLVLTGQSAVGTDLLAIESYRVEVQQ